MACINPPSPDQVSKPIYSAGPTAVLDAQRREEADVTRQVDESKAALKAARQQVKRAGTEEQVDRLVSDAKAAMRAKAPKSAKAPQRQSLTSLEAALEKAAKDHKRDIRETSIRAALPLTVATDLRIDRREELLLDKPLSAAELQPNTAYVYQDNVYITDGHGKTAYAKFTPTYTPNPPRHNVHQRAIGAEARHAAATPDQFVGGHLHGAALGGFPSGPNIFGQQANFNVSAMKTFENEFLDRAKNGEIFQVEIWLADDAPGDPTASVAILTYENSDGDIETHNLLNEGHQYK